MGKRYIMFIDERGFFDSGESNNKIMIGVIFEYDYCINSKYNECMLKEKLNEYMEGIFSRSNNDVPLDDIILKDNICNNINGDLKKKVINSLPTLLKGLKFTIIGSSIKKYTGEFDDLYLMLIKEMIKKFYLFILTKNGESAGIIMEAKEESDSCLLQQSFFNVYNEKSFDLSVSEDILKKINTFIICDKKDKTYGLGIQILNILNNELFRVYNAFEEVDKELIPYVNHGIKNKIYDSIKNKIHKNFNIGISNKIEIINEELAMLKEQLRLKDIAISEKEKEVIELNNQIKFLSNRLEDALINSQNKKIVTKILSDIDEKINDFGKVI